MDFIYIQKGYINYHYTWTSEHNTYTTDLSKHTRGKIVRAYKKKTWLETEYLLSGLETSEVPAEENNIGICLPTNSQCAVAFTTFTCIT